MREFVRQQVGSLKKLWIEKKSLFGAVVTRFVVLHAVLRQVVAQSEQKIIAAIVPRAPERARFSHELAQVLHLGCSSLERPGTVRNGVNKVRRRLAR